MQLAAFAHLWWVLYLSGIVGRFAIAHNIWMEALLKCTWQPGVVPNEEGPLFYVLLHLITLGIFYGRAVRRATRPQF
jgi:hypothetical protein